MRNNVRYLIVGDGRVARHMAHYFTQSHISFLSWCRKEPLDALFIKAADATHILLLVSDKAIEDIADSLRAQCSARLIHFSGALVSDKAIGAHPLMTFGNTLYELEKYRAIPFILDDDAPPFNDVLPLLPNPQARLQKNLKPRYHALCVLAGNFSCLLWQRFFNGLQTEMGIDAALGKPYLQQQTENILRDYVHALTGPLTRGDNATLEKNIAALGDDAYADVYRAFVAAYHAQENTS